MVKTFYDKYKDVGDRWGIPEEDVRKAINKGQNTLNREIQLNEVERFELPRYFKDVRSWNEYVLNLVEGWTTQKMIRCALYHRASQIDAGVTVRKTGDDKDWVVVRKPTKRISSKQDLLVATSNGIETPVEVQTALKTDQRNYHIKTYKVTQALKTGGIFMFVNVPGNWYFVVDPAKDITDEIPVVNNFAYGGKLCYEFSLDHVRNVLGVTSMNAPLSNKLRRLLELPENRHYSLRDKSGRFVARKKALREIHVKPNVMGAL